MTGERKHKHIYKNIIEEKSLIPEEIITLDPTNPSQVLQPLTYCIFGKKKQVPFHEDTNF